MRFITEFELDGNIDTKLLPHLIPDKKGIREMGIGKDIGRAFGWDNYGSTTLSGPVKEHFKLEIEAFPIDKWMKFKAGVSECIEQAKIGNYPPMLVILSIDDFLKELESYGTK